MTTDKTTILIVDDEDDIREPLMDHLEMNGFATLGAESAEQAYKVLQSEHVDLMVLDIMMPGESGLEMCKKLSNENIAKSSRVPIILLTALTDETDRIVGLELGADDYLGKPFNPRELIARIRSVLRRTESNTDGTQLSSYKFGDWTLNIDLGEISKANQVAVVLSTGELRLLKVFVENPNRILSRDELISLTRGRDSFPYERSIDNMISRLRKKIEADHSNPSYIQTVWGGGYKFNNRV